MSEFNTNDHRDLLWGDNASLAAFLGVSTKTVARYKAAPDTLPLQAVRLLKLRYGDLSGLLDSTWAGFTFRQGELFHPFYKCGFSADEVKGWFFGRQELESLRREVKTLRADLARQKDQAWASAKLYGIVRPSRPAASGCPAPQPSPARSDTPANKPPPPPPR